MATSLPELKVTARRLTPETLAAGVAVVFFAAALQRCVGFGRSVMFCRWLDAEQLGQWDMAQAFLMLAAPLAVLSLPGAFGRYVEHYRRRGQFKTFLARTTVLMVLLAAVTVASVWWARESLSRLIFGSPDHASLVALMAAVLLAIIAYNALVRLFAALRLQRVACGLELFNTVGFAVLGSGLLLVWQPQASSAVLAYGVASAVTVLLSLVWLRYCWRESEAQHAPTTRWGFLSKVVGFSVWLSLMNGLANLFTIADRYMIIHYSGLDADKALSLVGEYHSARIVAVLLTSVMVMLTSVVTPHCSFDWEAGRQAAVRRRLDLLLRSSGLLLCGVAVMFLALSPLLFDVLLARKFVAGQAVLALALMCNVWAGMTCIAQIYLVCTERPRLTSVAFLVGLCANILLNLVLLPRYGLMGAVLSTGMSNLLVLLLVLIFNVRQGMSVSKGCWLVALLPGILPWGAWPATVLLAGVATVVWKTEWLFDTEEKAVFANKFRSLSRLVAARIVRARSESSAGRTPWVETVES